MQFPLTLCYAITAHKAQGQTLSKVLIDQRNDSFAHGQTYVVFGRAQNRESVCVLVRPERRFQHDGEEHVLVRNVTYRTDGEYSDGESASGEATPATCGSRFFWPKQAWPGGSVGSAATTSS